jgi:drug/metabolite transporter (DMT)-like permease
MRVKVWIALLALYIVWGSTYLGIRFAVETIPPFLHAFVRFLVSGLILVAWRRMAGDPWPTPRQWRDAGIVGLFLLVGGNGLVSVAELTVPSGVAALVVGSTPLWLTTLEALRPGGAKPNLLVMLGILVGFIGIFILVGPSDLANMQMAVEPVGVTLLLMATFLWASGSIFSKTADLPPSSLMNTGTQMLVGSLGLLIASLLAGEWGGFDLAQVSSTSLWGLVYLIFFGSLVGFTSYIWLLKNAPISLVATYAYVNPIVAVILGSLLAAEELTPRIGIAAAIIIGAVVLINVSRQSRIQTQEKSSG